MTAALQPTDDPGFWVELKYDVELFIFEGTGRRSVGPSPERDVKVALFKDYDGTVILGMRVVTDYAYQALDMAQELAHQILTDLMADPDTEHEPNVPQPISMLVQDTESLRLAHRSEAEKAKVE